MSEILALQFDAIRAAGCKLIAQGKATSTETERHEPTAVLLLVTNEQPSIILCDMNVPLINGLELRRHIEGDAYLKREVIPYFLDNECLL